MRGKWNFKYSFFPSVLFCSSLARSFEPFHYYYLTFLFFQFSALKPDHPFQADLQIRPRNQTTTVHQCVRSAPHQTTTTDLMGPQIRSPNPSTIPDHQTRPFTKSDYQSRLPPPHQPTKLDQLSRLSSLTTQLQISTAHPASWSSTGQVHSLWVGARRVYRALDEPCKACYPHTFGLKHPDGLFGLTFL